jgi:hypothetical protein
MDGIRMKSQGHNHFLEMMLLVLLFLTGVGSTTFFDTIPLLPFGKNCWVPVKVRKPVYCTNRTLTGAQQSLCPCDLVEVYSPLSLIYIMVFFNF